MDANDCNYQQKKGKGEQATKPVKHAGQRTFKRVQWIKVEVIMLSCCQLKIHLE